MKYALNLEMVNMKTSKPNAFYMNSTLFWTEYFKCIAAAGFDTIEMQYNPYNADPYSFEIGRCGVPISRFAIQAKYKSVQNFLDMINGFGIKNIAAVHVDSNETLNEIFALDGDPKDYFNMISALFDEAIDFCIEANIKTITFTPTPEAGLMGEYYFNKTNETEKIFLEKLKGILKEAGEKTKRSGIKLALRNEFWSLLRGEKIIDYIKDIDCKNIYYSPDLAHLYISGADMEKVLTELKNKIECPRFNDTSFNDVHENYKNLNAETPVIGKQRIFYDLGDGKINIPHYRDMLKKQGYNGVVSCESRKTLDIYKGLLKTRWYIDHVLSD